MQSQIQKTPTKLQTRGWNVCPRCICCFLEDQNVSVYGASRNSPPDLPLAALPRASRLWCSWWTKRCAGRVPSHWRWILTLLRPLLGPLGSRVCSANWCVWFFQMTLFSSVWYQTHTTTICLTRLFFYLVKRPIGSSVSTCSAQSPLLSLRKKFTPTGTTSLPISSTAASHTNYGNLPVRVMRMPRSCTSTCTTLWLQRTEPECFTLNRRARSG
mmetsp:Transcript_52981/g.103638  ORF Transcript_52981/g.103638 Transcript_52981/m.103638 type:complete len:214 (-) Transcript_52981:438-1079(-)